MHSRGGRRRETASTSRKSKPNRFQLLDENPDNDDTAHAAARPFVPCSRPTTGKRVQLVLQFTACLVLSNVVLRFSFLTPITTWLVTENNKGPLSGNAASRNQQRLERRHQRQEHVRQRQQNSGVITNTGKEKEQEKNGKAAPSFREHQHQDLMNPHDSHPPDSIPLFSKPTALSLLYLSETALQRRHECIAAIRKRHDELLGPFLNPATVVRRRRDDEENQQQEEPRHHNVLLVDPAYHKNVGDHMITLGEIAFLQRMEYRASSIRSEETVAEMVYDECSYIQGGPFLPLCDDFLKQQQQHHENKSGSFLQVALWHGGGNWGDLWPKVQSMRASSLEPLFTALYNPIISMPQSLYFDDEQVFQQENTNIMRQAVMKEIQQASISTTFSGQQHVERRLILTWREQKSYDMAVKLYPFATHLIVPDIAFQLGPFAPIIENHLGENDETMAQKQRQPQLDILLLLRNDHESLYLHQRNRQAIRQILSSMTVKRSDGAVVTAGNRLGFAIVDWSDRLDRFESPSGKKDIFFTNTSIQLLSLGRVLVCDRLHAAILAYLMGIPFVFVDQSTGKIHRTLHTAFTSASLSESSNHNDTAAHLSPCLDATAAMWAQADNLTHALEKAIGFLNTSGK